MSLGLIIAGIAGVILLRAMVNAGASSGNAANQNVTKTAMAYVPFPHAGNAGTAQAGGVSNPRATNGNGQSLVSDPTAAAINIGSQDAVISGNYDSSNLSSQNGNPMFTYTDPSTGITSQEPTYWRDSPGSPDSNGQIWANFIAPINYSGPPTMVNCPPPSTNQGPDDSRFLQANGAISW